MHIRTLCVFGTRPEAIKLAPVIDLLAKKNQVINAVCVTGQHHEMLNSVLALFDIVPDYNLRVMTVNQTLSELTAKILQGMSQVFQEYKPDLVLVHGDTTTTMAVALAAYYHRIPVAHVEAGLRTGNIYEPWPEEANRKLTGTLALFHFAPTLAAKRNLLHERVDSNYVYVTGNTVIDSLFKMVQRLESDSVLKFGLQQQFPMLSDNRRFILVTGHRRENFGGGFERICKALAIIAERFPDVDIIYPVHLNPNVRIQVESLLNGISNVHLILPVDYLPFVYLMKMCWLILTDSGGVQEEAPALGKPVLVMRKLTERPEAVEAGTAALVGTDVDVIVSYVSRLLDDKSAYNSMSGAKNPYGDGEAATRIVEVILANADKIKRMSQHSTNVHKVIALTEEENLC